METTQILLKKRNLYFLQVLTWSLWFRQTNIIWVAFVAGVIGLQWVERERERERGKSVLLLCVCVLMCGV